MSISDYKTEVDVMLFNLMHECEARFFIITVMDTKVTVGYSHDWDSNADGHFEMRKWRDGEDYHECQALKDYEIAHISNWLDADSVSHDKLFAGEIVKL